MELRNTLQTAAKAQNVSPEAWEEAVDNLLLLLAPMAPHITEELWAQRGQPYSIHQQAWPVWDARNCQRRANYPDCAGERQGARPH